MKTAKKVTRSARRQKRAGLTDAEIREAFNRLGLQHLEQTSYTNARDFSRHFQRCSLLQHVEMTYAAHSGV